MHPVCRAFLPPPGPSSPACSDRYSSHWVPPRLGARGHLRHRLLLPIEKTTPRCLSWSCRWAPLTTASAAPRPHPVSLSTLPAPSSVNMAAAAALPVQLLDNRPPTHTHTPHGGTITSPERQWRFPSLGCRGCGKEGRERVWRTAWWEVGQRGGGRAEWGREGGRREVVKATASARLNLPTPRSMRGTVHTCSAGPLKSTKQPCAGRIPQKDAETW